MADISFQGLKNIIANEKKGFTYTDTINSLSTLATLVNNMNSVRASAYCPSHTTIPISKNSLGDYYNIIQQLKACTCDAKTSVIDACNCNSRTNCSCVSRTTSYCSCNTRTAVSCTCYSRTASTCTCNTRTGTSCTCNSRTGEACTCQYNEFVVSNTMSCSCDLQTCTAPSGCDAYSSQSCLCNTNIHVASSGVSTCTCDAQTADTFSCTKVVGGTTYNRADRHCYCNALINICSCNGRTAVSASEYSYYSDSVTSPYSDNVGYATSPDAVNSPTTDCTSNIGSDCPSRTGCSSYTRKEFT